MILISLYIGSYIIRREFFISTWICITAMESRPSFRKRNVSLLFQSIILHRVFTPVRATWEGLVLGTQLWDHIYYYCWVYNVELNLWRFFNLNPGAPALRKTGGARCWQQLPFSTFKLDFERHRSDSDKRFFSKIAGTVFWQTWEFETRITWKIGSE